MILVTNRDMFGVLLETALLFPPTQYTWSRLIMTYCRLTVSATIR